MLFEELTFRICIGAFVEGKKAVFEQGHVYLWRSLLLHLRRGSAARHMRAPQNALHDHGRGLNVKSCSSP